MVLDQLYLKNHVISVNFLLVQQQTRIWAVQLLVLLKMVGFASQVVPIQTLYLLALPHVAVLWLILLRHVILEMVNIKM